MMIDKKEKPEKRSLNDIIEMDSMIKLCLNNCGFSCIFGFADILDKKDYLNELDFRIDFYNSLLEDSKETKPDKLLNEDGAYKTD